MTTLDFQLTLFNSIQEGTDERGAGLNESVRSWGAQIAGRLAATVEEKDQTWFNTPVEGMANPTNPWFVQERNSADGNTAGRFLCSLPPGGEQLTGILRSKTFTIPDHLDFFIAGHDGFPGQPGSRKRNVFRLRLALGSRVLAEAAPPRNDLAQPVNWNLSAHAGEEGYLEIVDGDNGTAYAPGWRWDASIRCRGDLARIGPAIGQPKAAGGARNWPNRSAWLRSNRSWRSGSGTKART